MDGALQRPDSMMSPRLFETRFQRRQFAQRPALGGRAMAGGGVWAQIGAADFSSLVSNKTKMGFITCRRPARRGRNYMASRFQPFWTSPRYPGMIRIHCRDAEDRRKTARISECGFTNANDSENDRRG